METRTEEPTEWRELLNEAIGRGWVRPYVISTSPDDPWTRWSMRVISLRLAATPEVDTDDDE